jgi:hypothetical protein
MLATADLGGITDARETKIVVSTEKEESTEHEYYSEIVYANNELAVAYDFYTLQHLYQVFTYLAEVESVIIRLDDFNRLTSAFSRVISSSAKGEPLH